MFRSSSFRISTSHDICYSLSRLGYSTFGCLRWLVAEDEMESRNRLMQMKLLVLILLATIFLGFSPRYSLGQSSVTTKDSKAPLTELESKAVKNCLEIIRSCQLKDGSFRMVDEGDFPESPVWIAPYFVQHAMLALLVANDHVQAPADVDRVRKWLQWCAEHQEQDGYWYDYTGTLSSYRSNAMVDAHDSSAAMFLLVVERYQRSGGKMSKEVINAAKRSLRCITILTDEDGLTWAKPDYKVKYLMDNVEVHAGLKSAIALFSKTGDREEVAVARKQDSAMSKSLNLFWEATEKDRFAYVLHPTGVFEGGFDDLYPHGLAQLFGISWVVSNSKAFAATCDKFEPQTTPEGVGAERYLMAASRLASEDLMSWREAVVKDANTFTSKSIYLFRPGLVVLSLYEGSDWMAK